MKRTILIIMFLVFVSFAYADYDRTDFYYNGTYYFTDGMQGDLALNGATPNNKDTVSSYGWLLNSGSCNYSNSNKLSNNLSILIQGNMETGGINELHFNGTMGASLYYDGTSTYAQFLTKDGSAVNMLICMGLGVCTTFTNFSYSDNGGPILECGIPVTVGWHNFSYKFGPGYIAGYIDNTLCHNFTTANSLNTLKLAEGGDYGGFYADEIWVASGDKPTEVGFYVSNVNIQPQEPITLDILNGKGRAIFENPQAKGNYTYKYKWYKNGLFFKQGNYTNVLYNTDQIINNLTSDNTTVGDSFIFSLAVVNSTNSTAWLNGSAVTITDYFIDDCSIFNYTILNITYYDEKTFEPINATNSYELHNVELNTDISGVLPSAHSHKLCALSPELNTLYGTITLSNPGYEVDIVENSIDTAYNGNPYYLNVYLTGINNGSTVTFTIKDSLTKDTLTDVQINMFQLYNGTYHLTGSKLSGATGKAVFDYLSDKLYKFDFYKSGYNNLSYNFNPITSLSYDIYLVKTNVQDTAQTFDRVLIDITPQQFYEGKNDYSINFYSPYQELNSYSFNWTFPGGYKTGIGTTKTGQIFTGSFNITGATQFDRVKIDLKYNTDLAGTRNIIYYFDIINATSGNYTFMQNKNKTYGLGLFERILISVFGAILIVGIPSLMGQILPGLILAIIFLFYLVYIGFIPLWLILISVFVSIILIASRSE